MADKQQESRIKHIRRVVRERTEPLVSKAREMAPKVAERLRESKLPERVLAQWARVRASRRRTVLLGGGAALVIALLLLVGINLVSKPGAADQTLVELGLKEGARAQAGGLLASGFIEAEEVNLATEIGGRVVELPFDEGDEVQAGDVVVRLGSGTLEAELAAARAQLDIVLARQAMLDEGAREEVVAQSQAGLMAAEAARDGAYDAWQDAAALRDNPQEISVRVAEAYTNYTVAQAEAKAAQARYDEAARVQWLYENVPGAVDLYLQRGRNPNVAPNERSAGDKAWQLQETRDIAQATLGGSSATLAALANLRDNPQALEAQVINAEAQFHAADARLSEAQANYDLVLKGASQDELTAAQAQVDQAKAAVEGLEQQLAKLTIAAPTGGVMLDRTVLEGELAVPGVTLVTLADLDEVKLTVFVPEDQLDKVHIGQEVQVTVDSFPDRVFDGTVATIANEAEFTPRSVVTREERVSLVFAVEVRLPNPDHALKPGMPADAVLLSAT